jgi:hypothetical protein
MRQRIPEPLLKDSSRGIGGILAYINFRGTNIIINNKDMAQNDVLLSGMAALSWISGV